MDYIYELKIICILFSLGLYLSLYYTLAFSYTLTDKTHNYFIVFYLFIQRENMYERIKIYYSAEIYKKIGIDVIYIIMPILMLVIILAIILYKRMLIRKNFVHEIIIENKCFEELENKIFDLKNRGIIIQYEIKRRKFSKYNYAKVKFLNCCYEEVVNIYNEFKIKDTKFMKILFIVLFIVIDFNIKFQ